MMGASGGDMFARFFAPALIGAALYSAPAAALEVTPATPAQAVAIVTAQDEVIQAMTPADLSIRLHGGTSREALLRQYAAAVEPWSDAESARLTAMVARHRAQLDAIARWLPDQVLLIKNTRDIDGGLPHTRANAILFGPNLPTSDAELDELFLHELWHVLSRHNAARHDEIYALIGFQPCTSVALPDDLRARLVTNPDAPLTRWGVATRAQGHAILLAPLLVAEPAVYDPAHPGFTDYFALRFIGLTRHADGSCAPYAAVPFIAPDAAMPALFAAAGHNTDYVLHPEELLADNFAQLMTAKPNVPDPQVQARLAHWLGIEAPVSTVR
jgi:hypothetical protein